MRRPVRIGVTGGIGSGKSTLVTELARRGCAVFSADEQVHRLYATSESLRSQLRARWGASVLSDGTVDRARIAAIVFADPAERAWLESIVHPLVGAAWETFASLAHDVPAVVAEVPLLFEANVDDRYDLTVLVTAPESVRVQRIESRGSAAADAVSRMQAQLTDEVRAQRADLVIENTGSIADVARLADDVLAAANRVSN